MLLYSILYIPYQYFEDCLLYWNAIDYLPAVPVVVSSRLHNLSESLIKKESSETFEDKKGKKKEMRLTSANDLVTHREASL